MNKRYLIESTKSLKDISCYIYPFPTGRLYLFGDNDYLRLVLWGNEILKGDHTDEIFNNHITREIGIAIEFIDRFLLGENGSLPNLDLNSFTDREKFIYQELMKVSFGETISYGRLSMMAGGRNAARFVGNTMAKNHFPIFIPCHRVIKADGTIGNYSSGRWVKLFLLEHERVICEKRKANG
ncbi:MAG: methylated-DNA--[protein]-cysteine S-methyltransferase [Spirochaetota bacterium]|nr:methylated-DNA--[protein]-cysteine S-methyltransferase [Spirochaetota bacterium]